MTIEQLKSTTKGRASLSSGWVFKPEVHGASGWEEGYSRKSLACPMTAQALQNTWRNFSLPGQCIMDEKGLEAGGYDVLRTMSQENVRYAEIRFAPLLSETSGMNCRAVIEAVLKRP